MTDPSSKERAPSRIGPKVAVDRNLQFHESLIHMLWHAVEGRPDRVAVIYQDRSITYRDFGRATNGLAALLESLGLEPGPIVIMMPNSIEMDVARDGGHERRRAGRAGQPIPYRCGGR